MSDKVKIKATERELKGKHVKSIRKDGQMPAVIYGKDRKPLALTLDAHEFALMYRHGGGNTIVEIEIEKADGTKEKKNVLVHEIASDPVSRKILHADLLQIKMNEKITATVPLVFVGDSVAVIDLGGSLLTTKDEVEVECFPADLPHEIQVDLSTLADFDSVIHVEDLVLPEGVVILDDVEEVIAHVEAPRSDEELAEMEEPVEQGELPESEHGEAAPTTEEPAEESSEE